MPWHVNNKAMSFFSHKNCFFGSRTRGKISKVLWEVKKYAFKFSFILGVQKLRLGERIPHMISELRLDNILPLFWPKNCPKIIEIAIMVYFDVFFWPTHEPNII